jgi:pimeloyl-ACP methyl ester carboxylesterase
MSSMPVDPFLLPFSQVAVDDLHDRLRRTRWLIETPGSAWTYGVDREFLTDICEYWREHFDWEGQVTRLSILHHYRYLSDGTAVHFIHEHGKGPDPIPLILTHGWPGSFAEMEAILPLLIDPAAYGADPADSFDVVVPSLPGFGFSVSSSGAGMNAFQVADLWVRLMNELGYSRFGAQGGDLGAAVSTALGLRHAEHLLGIHLNYVPGSYRPYLEPGTKPDPIEEQFLTDASHWYDENGAYAHVQGTCPQTAAYGLNDSPAGLAAWILEKFRDWSDCGGDIYRRFSRDQLLTNVTIYWMTQTISSSFGMYFEGRRAPLHFQKDESIRVPCAFAHFPKEIMFPPRQWVERGYDVHRWTEMPRGGHFAAAEEPNLLAEDIRSFFRRLRR